MLDKSSEPLMSRAMRTVIEHCHSLLSVKPVPILLSLEGKGPAVLGIHNPVMILPEWFLSQASEDDRSTR